MTDRGHQPKATKMGRGELAAMPIGGIAIMKSVFRSMLPVLVLVGVSAAADLPDAPSAVMPMASMMVVATVPPVSPRVVETKTLDIKFVSLALVSAGSTFADSYTTLFATQNWLAGKKGVCNMEAQSPYLYGIHPTAGRAYAVASAKSAGSILASYYLRKHHSKLWSLPLVANSVLSLQGTAQNLATCN
jgi:hypothetical protein